MSKSEYGIWALVITLALLVGTMFRTSLVLEASRLDVARARADLRAMQDVVHATKRDTIRFTHQGIGFDCQMIPAEEGT